jgi:hypothetical protein
MGMQTAYQKKWLNWKFSKYGKGAADFEKGTLLLWLKHEQSNSSNNWPY